MSNEPLLELQNICKSFTISKGCLGRGSKVVHAVNKVSLKVYSGETLGIVGESGCGKSTLARTLLRLTEPTAGSIIFHGKDITHLSSGKMRQLRQKLQLIFQDPLASLSPNMTVLEIVQAPLDVFNIGTREERKAKVVELLRIVGLDEHQLHRFPHQFSGGQCQRIGIARALILNPEIVVCDEPVSALDVSVRANVLNLLRQLQEDFGLTYIFISHDLSVIKHISDRIAVMYLGQIVEIGSKADIFKNPLHPYTKALLAAIPLPDPHKRLPDLPIKGELPSPYEELQGCPFAPRCPYANSSCLEAAPQLVEISSGHWVACSHI